MPSDGPSGAPRGVAAASRRGGADHVLVGDRHGAGGGHLQNTPLLGALLADLAGGPRVGALFLASLWPPLLLVEQVETLVTLAGADERRPFLAVLALGRNDEAVAAMGVEPGQRVPRLEDAVARLSGRPPVELWIAAEHGRALARAGRVGGGWLANAYFPPDVLVGQRATVEDARRQAGHGDGLPSAVRRDVLCAATDAEARTLADRALAEGYRGGLDPAALLVGSTATCAAGVDRLDGLGFDHVVIRPMLDDAQAAADTERFLVEVPPLLAH